MFIKSDRIVTLDIGASKVLLAEFMAPKSGVPELLNYGMGHMGPNLQGAARFENITSTIKRIMREHEIRPAPLFMTVSGQAVFPRFVKLPPASRDKLDQIVRYEAEQNVPFPINEVVWDYQLVSDVQGEQHVLLVAVKIENVKALTDAVGAAGMEPELVDVAPMALYNCICYNYPDIEGCSMVLDMGAKSTNLIFVEGSRIFSRSIPVAGNTISQEIAKGLDVPFEEAEALKLERGFVGFGGVYAAPDDETAEKVSKITRSVVTRLHAEVNRSINFYRSQQGGSAPVRLFMTGGSSMLQHLDTFFGEKLGIDVEYVNPFVNIEVNADLDTEVVEGDVPLMSEVAGLALRRSLACPMEINLMPPELVSRKTFRRRQPYFAVTAVGVALIMLCWWVYSYRMSSFRMDQLARVREKIETFENVQESLKRVKNREKTAKENVEDLLSVVNLRTQWLEIIDSVHSAMPEGMWLTAVEPVVTDDGFMTHVDISGKGFDDKMKLLDNPEARQVFRDRLRESECFTGKTDITVRPLMKPGDFAREFTIRLALAKPVKVGSSEDI
ncbi:MAG: type IV pilus assembly protein PilM [Kiritimatiellia bacterium]